jgi:hypothetical protein
MNDADTFSSLFDSLFNGDLCGTFSVLPAVMLPCCLLLVRLATFPRWRRGR